MERRIMIAVDESEESMYALEWALDNLVHKNQGNDESLNRDRVIVVHAENQSPLAGQGLIFS